MQTFSIAVHGGAGTISKRSLSPEKEAAYRKGLETARDAGYDILISGGSALDAVETAVKYLEDDPLFNAGKGSVFTAKGTHEMDAGIMNGMTRDCGAVAGITTVKHPISLARAIMEKTQHVLFFGEGAFNIARRFGLEEKDAHYFFDQFRYDQLRKAQKAGVVQLDHGGGSVDQKFGTVGAVARDISGHLAAATSTGGMTNKLPGRIGDTPIAGAGFWADDATCAISCTGSGEYFIRSLTAANVHYLILLKKMPIAKAVYQTIHKLLKAMGGDGGLIAVDASGTVVLDFNTSGMYRSARHSNGSSMTAIHQSPDGKKRFILGAG